MMKLPSKPADDRLNRTLKLIFAVLIVYTASTLILGLAAVPSYYQRLTTRSVPVVQLGSQITMSNAIVEAAAASRGMTVETYAAYSIVLKVGIALGFVSVAALILWKARREWFHWFTAFVLLFYPTGELEDFTLVAQIAYSYINIGALLWPSLLLFLYLFPNGKAVPRWTRWVIGGLALLHFIAQAGALAVAVFDAPDAIMRVAIPLFVVVPVAFLIILCCQVYRYVRQATPVERAQIKWFVAGLAFSVVVGAAFWALVGAVSVLSNDLGFATDLDTLSGLFIPVTLGIGILRYRLYDIDLIIRRTLIYGTLTATLALAYLGSVVLLQQLFRFLTGQGTNQLVIVASTLLIAALFQPLRRRIQASIDRRFFRRKYDAGRILAAFSANLRDEVEIDRLTNDLVGVVDETLRPAHVSLWLRPTGRH